MYNNHISVLKNEVINYLNIRENANYYDATFGAGGHSMAILDICDNINLWATDKDQKVDVYENIKNKNFKFIRSDFVEFLKNFDTKTKFDGILADIGVSNMQLFDGDRGFSFRYDAPLDMRMDKNQTLTAYNVINEYSDKELYKIIKIYGEEKKASKITNAIIKNRPIKNTLELAKIIEKIKKNNQTKTHSATQTFQAIRIEVNQELKKLEKFLELAINKLNNKGRLAIISFHSLEDRIVKNTFKKFQNPCNCPKNIPYCICNKKPLGKIITKKPIIASKEELEKNPKSRSAKLRVFERII